MKKPIQTLLKSFGVDEALFPDLEKDDFDTSTVLESLNENQKKHWYKVFENDADYQQINKDKATGQVKATMDNHLKKFGFEDDEHLPMDKKIAKFGNFLTEKIKGEVGNPKQEIAEMQKKHLEDTNGWTEKEKEYQKKLEETEKSADARVNSRLSEIKLKELFHNIEPKNILTGKHTPGVFNTLKGALSSKYDIKYKDEDIYFTVKGKESKPTAKIDGKEVILENNNDILIQELKAEGLYVESNGGNGGGGAAGAGTSGGEGTKESAEVKAMRERIQSARQTA